MPTPRGATAPTSPLPVRFRTLRSEPASGARNMAIDLALLDRARSAGEAVWRCYAWSRPTISFGRNEAARVRFDAASVSRPGFDAVRRPTGGRALFHSREVTYSVTAPVAPDIPWRMTYAAINAVLVQALRALGVQATLVPDAESEAVRPDGPVCFDRPAAGEIVVEGAKLVGSAIWRERGAYLQHGSILLHDDQSLLATAMITPPTFTTPPAASLNALFASRGLPCPSWSNVAAALEHALAAQHDVTPLEADASLIAATERKEGDLSSTQWLWRR